MHLCNFVDLVSLSLETNVGRIHFEPAKNGKFYKIVSRTKGRVGNGKLMFCLIS